MSGFSNLLLSVIIKGVFVRSKVLDQLLELWFGWTDFAKSV